MANVNPIGRNIDIIVQELKTEIFIYDLRVNKALCLNQTTALIWQECNGSQSVYNISLSISRKINKDIDTELVCLGLEQLYRHKLLVNGEAVVAEIQRAARRAAVKKLASSIALPMIYAVIAPAAAAAQSAGSNSTGKALNASCFVSSECCSGYCDDCFTGTCQPAPNGLGGCL